MEDAIQIEDRWYVLATSSRADDRTRVLKHGETFAVFDRRGDIHRIGTGVQGIYHQGTRFLSQLELRLNGQRPMLLNSNVRQDNSLLTVDLTTPDCYEGERLVVLKGTVHIFRAKLLWQGCCHEHLRLANYGEAPVMLTLTLEFGADYADIFEVRGFRRARRGQDLATAVLADSVLLGYRGLDGKTRHTAITFAPRPTHVAPERVIYEITLNPKEQSDLHIAMTCDPAAPGRCTFDYIQALTSIEAALHGARARACDIRTSNQQFNDWLDRSGADLVMLNTDTPDGPYPFAGVPWYSTPFGRDGILTALQYLWVDPAIARGVLAYLANAQASHEDPARDAEPGKILHETREGELAALGEIPFNRYYGSIDSTPLFVVLAGSYFERTGDLEFIHGIWPNVERALAWVERYGDADGDGFVEYRRKSEDGLVNQGWKDSEDAVFHRDGTLAEGPIALAEVQGYVYQAKLHGAALAQALDQPKRAVTLRREALDLRKRFERVFWSKEIGTYAIALDGGKRPCLVRSSNAGQVLWTGIASRARAQRTGDALLAPASFSGWGVRTIAAEEARYNPMSYHNGSIWPHDNALIAMGLARYGMRDKALAIVEAIFQASLFMELHRLPELYCGFVRRPNEGPTLYPVACSPQAWASASAFYLLQTCLGVSFVGGARCVRFDHPLLPPSLDRLEIRDLRVGDGMVDLAFERHECAVSVNVLRKKGDVEVSVIL